MTERRSELLDAARTAGLDRSSTLLSVLAAPGFDGVIPVERVTAIRDELGYTDTHQLMQNLIPLARVYSTPPPPISHYSVGVVGEGKSGSLYFGFNMEEMNMSLGETVHGEQTAVVNAWSHGETGLKSLALSAAPCGHCRQFLYETDGGAHMAIMFPGAAKTTLAHLLPHAFGPHDLGLTSGLMAAPSAQLAQPTANADPLLTATYAAAENSYAPYSKGPAAVGIETKDGSIITGMYAENAAFNPTLAPILAALVLLRLHGHEPEDIRRVDLVAVPSAIDHVTRTRAILAASGVNQDLKVHFTQVEPRSPVTLKGTPVPAKSMGVALV